MLVACLFVNIGGYGLKDMSFMSLFHNHEWREAFFFCLYLFQGARNATFITGKRQLMDQTHVVPHAGHHVVQRVLLHCCQGGQRCVMVMKLLSLTSNAAVGD